MTDNKWRWPWVICDRCEKITNRDLWLGDKETFVCKSCAISILSKMGISNRRILITNNELIGKSITVMELVAEKLENMKDKS
jgi:hypothetical protein